LFRIVRVEAGSAYLTRPGRTTSSNGVKLNHLLHTTASKQVIYISLYQDHSNHKQNITHFVCFSLQVANCFTRYPIIRSWPRRLDFWTAYGSMTESAARLILDVETG